MSLDRRIGEFSIPDVAMGDKNLLIEIQKECAIVRAEFEYHLGALVCIGYSEHFKETPQGCSATKYDVVIESDWNGHKYVETFKGFTKC